MVEEFEDPTSRYQNPRYSGKGVPDRANSPKRRTPAQQFDEKQHAVWDNMGGLGMFSSSMATMIGNTKQRQSANRYLKKKSK